MAAPTIRVPVHILYRQMKNFNLRAISKIKLSFDPFHNKVASIRDVVFLTSADRVRSSNEKCVIRNDVRSDLSEPQIDVEFSDGRKAILKTANLSTLDIMAYFENISQEKDNKAAEAPVKK